MTKAISLVDVEKRIRFVDVRISQSDDGGATGHVTLSIRGGGTVVGTAHSDSEVGGDGEIRCAAEATARALESHSDNRVTLTIHAVYPVADLDTIVVVVSPSVGPGATTRRLVGSSLSEGSAPRAASLAVLSATNRFLGNLLGDSATLRFRGEQIDEEISLRERLIGELTTLHERTAQLRKAELREGELVRELEVSERRFAESLRNTQQFVCTHDVYGSIVSVNDAAAQALGYVPDEMAGCLLKEFISEKYRADFPNYLQRVQASGADQGLMRVVTRTGEDRIWLYRNRLEVGADGASHIIAFAQDITDPVNAGVIGVPQAPEVSPGW